MRTTVQVHAERVDGGRSGAGVRRQRRRKSGEALEVVPVAGWVTCLTPHSRPPSLTHQRLSVRQPLHLCAATPPSCPSLEVWEEGPGEKTPLRAALSALPGMAVGVAGTSVPLLHSFMFCHAWGHGRNKYCHRRRKDAGGDRVGKLGACWESLSGSLEALSPPAALPLVFVASMFGGGRSRR